MICFVFLSIDTFVYSLFLKRHIGKYIVYENLILTPKIDALTKMSKYGDSVFSPLGTKTR